jgi:AcrR family transcriptional regulator
MIVNLRRMANRVKQDSRAVSAAESSPRSPARSGAAAGARRPGTARREAIFAAALRLFRERGFHGTAINDIGAAAGVTGPALYRHFDSKGAVLREAILEGSNRMAAAIRAALAQEAPTPEAALEALTRATVEAALENADIFAAYVLEARHLDKEIRKSLRQRELRHREEWARLLLGVHPDVDPEQARTLVAMAIYSLAALCMEPSRLARPQLVELATERVMALLLAPAPG